MAVKRRTFIQGPQDAYRINVQQGDPYGVDKYAKWALSEEEKSAYNQKLQDTAQAMYDAARSKSKYKSRFTSIPQAVRDKAVRKVQAELKKSSEYKAWKKAKPDYKPEREWTPFGAPEPVKTSENTMTRGEAKSMANAYEPGLATQREPFNTQAVRDVAQGKSGIVGNTKAGESVYNPKSKTRKAVESSVNKRRIALQKQSKDRVLDRAKSRIF